MDDLIIAPDLHWKAMPSAGTRGTRRRSFAMSDTMQSIFADSFQIAWDYLEASGELGNPDTAAGHLLDTIEAMIRLGERRRLVLANKAIIGYQRFRAEQRTLAASIGTWCSFPR